GFGGGFDDLGDIFESMFGGGFGGFSGGGRRNPNGPARGNDLKQSITITFEEAAFGVTKEIKVNREEECTKCGGSGARSKDDVETCTRCSGSGRVVEVQNTILGRVQTQTVCPECSGKGKRIKHKCDSCNGRGAVNKAKTIEVKVPAGIDDGQQIRLSGQGEAGRNGGPSGDLYVAFRVKSHDFFVRDGFDLRCEVPITYSQAVLGAEIEVPTLTGKVVLKVPEGTQPGTEFRVRDKGIKYINRDLNGDLYVKVKLIVPKKVSSKQRELLSEFDALEDKTGSIWDKVKKAFK
ncbi:MAG TPA: molecular chaperone DnaJ, partial [Firmicutes bacterium]|nr:molecular chaperone DnaJ [Bacillota bacterium]